MALFCRTKMFTPTNLHALQQIPSISDLKNQVIPNW